MATKTVFSLNVNAKQLDFGFTTTGKTLSSLLDISGLKHIYLVNAPTPGNFSCMVIGGIDLFTGDFAEIDGSVSSIGNITALDVYSKPIAGAVVTATASTVADPTPPPTPPTVATLSLDATTPACRLSFDVETTEPFTLTLVAPVKQVYITNCLNVSNTLKYHVLIMGTTYANVYDMFSGVFGTISGVITSINNIMVMDPSGNFRNGIISWTYSGGGGGTGGGSGTGGGISTGGSTERFESVSETVTVAAGATHSGFLTVPYNIFNIAKIKVSQSVFAATSKFSIFNNNTYVDADKVYGTLEYSGDLIDPVEDTGTLVTERNEGFVCAYEDKSETKKLWYSIENTSGGSCDYTVDIIIDNAYADITFNTSEGAPSGIVASASASYLTITTGVTASKNNSDINSAEFRAKFVAAGVTEAASYDLRTLAEGGSFTPDGITAIQETGIDANASGAEYIFTSASPGTWYYAWRLHNATGWSNWSDGNSSPGVVTQFVKTRNATSDAAPPADWDMYLQDGPVSNSLICVSTRPKVNADVINWYVVQVKDASTGAWTSLYNGPDPDNIRWDGTSPEVALTLNSTGKVLTKTDGLGWGTAVGGDLVLLDVRGSGTPWNESYCQWGRIEYVWDANTITLQNALRPQTRSNMRAVIIKPPWNWTSGGYLGGYAGKGFWPQLKSEENLFIGDVSSQEFKTKAIIVPAAVTNFEARAWFENEYCRSDDSQAHTSGMIGLPCQMTWTKFNDTRWWIPKWPRPQLANLSFNSSGQANIVSVARGVTTTSGGGIWGLMGHFSIYPDTNGTLMYRVKFENVNIPQYTDTDYNNECTAVFVANCVLSDAENYRSFQNGAFFGNYRNNADVYFGAFRAWLADNFTNISPPYLGTTGNPAYLAVARPSPPYILEIRVGFTTGVGASRNIEFTCTTLEYRLGATGAYTTFNAGVQTGLWVNMDSKTIMTTGYTPVLGIFEGMHNAAGKLLPSFSARLTEFAVEHGVIRQHRIV